MQFLGEVSTDDQSIELYAGALAVVFPPFDEDYGYVTLEAFLSHKPVVTTTDAGGPNEFVTDGANGWVTAPDPQAIARGHSRRSTPTGAERHGWAMPDTIWRAASPGPGSSTGSTSA